MYSLYANVDFRRFLVVVSEHLGGFAFNLCGRFPFEDVLLHM